MFCPRAFSARRRRRHLATLSAAILWCGGASAPPHSVRAVTPESLALARTLTEATGTGGLAAMNGLALPFPKLMNEMGIADSRHYGVIVHEDVMAVLNEHSDGLTDMQVKSYASLLSVDDMKAAIAFFATPAGHDLVHLRFKLLQTNMAQAGALLQKLHPDIDAKTQQTLAAHGWTKG